MAITPEDLDGFSEDLARRVLVVARSIAPCLDNLIGERRAEAIAILKGVAQGAQLRADRSVQSQGVGSARVTYGPTSSWFFQDDRDALKALCPAVDTSGHPVGRFPAPDKMLSRIWPEERE